ncbi:MAG TPA: hypothetical protein VFG89_02400 [Coriobacteriia bacterium]|nr:hypothetical protein [Coriobacteriia bacterium]
MRLRIINNFLHDTCTGTWAACLIVLLVLESRLAGIPAEAVRAIQESQMAVFWLAVVALVGLAVTGGIRLGYWRREATPEELAEKRRLLWIKHVAFLVVYGLCTVWAWSIAR